MFAFNGAAMMFLFMIHVSHIASQSAAFRAPTLGDALEAVVSSFNLIDANKDDTITLEELRNFSLTNY